MKGHQRSVLIALFCLGCARTATAQTPGAPTGLTANENPPLTVTLQWLAPSSGGVPTGYLVQGGTSPGGSNTVNQQIGNTTSYTTSPLSASTTYYFRVRALNASGISGPSNEVVVSTGCPTPPAAPDAVLWRVFASDILRVIWTTGSGPDGFPQSFRVEVGTAPGLTDIATQSVSSRSYADIPLPGGVVTAHARVIPINGCGDGPVSEEVTVVTSATAPSTSIVVNELFYFLELKNISSSPIDISGWEVFSSLEERQVFLNATIPASTLIPPGCTFLLGFAGEDVRLQRRAIWGSGVARPDGSIVDSVGRSSGGSELDISPFAEGTRLPRYDPDGPQVSFARVNDQDTNNNQADFIQLATPNPIGLAGCGPRVPNAPSELRAAVNGPTVTLDWILPASNPPLTQLVLEAGLTPAATTFGPFALAPNQTAITFSGVPDGTYYLRLRAANAMGVSAPSNEVAVVVCWQNCTVPPGTVTLLTHQVSGNTVLLAWQRPNTGGTPTDYVIEAGTSSGLSNLGQFPIGATTEFVIIAGVPPGTYYVRVRAFNAGGLGPSSNEVVVIVVQ